MKSYWNGAASVLVAAGLSMGCAHAEGDAPAESSPTESPEDVTGTVASAVTGTYYDFLANAPGAYWVNNDGGIAWGTNDTRGACYTATGTMENGTSYPYLFTQPKSVANGYMHGAFTVTVPVGALHPSLTATFGFKQGASASDGVTFAVTTQVNGADVTLFTFRKTYTGALTTKTADLSAYGGQKLQLILSTDAGSGYTTDWAAWTDVRVVADTGGAPNGGCTIGGVNYERGASNPAVSCQVCDPTASTSAWSIKADTCQIGGTCYAANVADALGCKLCDPSLSQTTWSDKASCDSLLMGALWWGVNGAAGGSAPETNGDATCHNYASANGLPGKWRAAFSVQNGRSYKDAVPGDYWTKPVLNLKGEQLYPSWNALFTNQVAANTIYDIGNSPTALYGAASTGKVWTGTGTNGLWQESSDNAHNCVNWSQTAWLFGGYLGRVGDLNQRKLLNDGTESWCTSSNRLVCVLVPNQPPITLLNYDGSAMGPIQGKPQGNAMAYLGIPYAAPPTGANRFAPPKPATSWSGMRYAFSQAPMCPQPPFLPLGGYIGSEDCLYLNVWTPKNATSSSNLPVIVFNPGGGMMFGGTQSVADWVGAGVYDGDRLAATQNVVVVTLQTRLAALGFLATPALSATTTTQTSTAGTSGNYGLLDGLQALKWIKKNIARFGGDPNRVMLSGHSGGASLAAELLAMGAKDPADNKAYFSSAWLMSGFYEAPAMSVATGTAAGMPANRLTMTRYSQASNGQLAAIGCDQHHMSGTPTLTFTEVGATGDKITRSTGSWLTDGFAVGDVITISGSASNNVTGAIAALTATVITLGTTDLAPEGPVSSCKVDGSNPTTEVACLRSAPVQGFVNALGPFLSVFPTMFNGAIPPELGFGLPFGPNVDGQVVPAEPRARIAAGLHTQVPIVLGNAQDEMNTFMIIAAGGIATLDWTKFIYVLNCGDRHNRAVTNLGAALASTVESLYPCNWLNLPILDPTLTYARAGTDGQYVCPGRRLARALVTGQTQPVRRYKFTHRADLPGVFQNLLGFVPQVGAAHALDVPYVFNTHAATLWYWPSGREQDLTTRMQRYWAAMATNGDPNYSGTNCPSGANCWAAYNRTSDNWLNIKAFAETGLADPGPQMANTSTSEANACDVWDNNWTLDGWK